MVRRLIFILSLCFSINCLAQIRILDSKTALPVSYATVSFGNGNGLFADDEGQFIFTKKLYPDVDSLFISALGYKPVELSATDLPAIIEMEIQADELDEIVIAVPDQRKFKLLKNKPYLDDDYYKCWLPTIESEIAVFIPNEGTGDKQLYKVQFPIALESRDWNKRNSKNAEKKEFSTLFKIRIYENKSGLPGAALTNQTIVFRATERNGDYFELDLDEYNIMMEAEGLFVSIQVLGYTDKDGKLLPNKKYKEVKGRDGMVKIPTNFRPLLPFTDEIVGYRTFIKRVFISGNSWKVFKPGTGIESTLLDNGYTNYGAGVTLKLFKD